MINRSTNSFNSNFQFLEKEFSLIANIGNSAELYCYSDPSVSLQKSRLCAEKITEFLFDYNNLTIPEKCDFNTRLKILKQNDFLPFEISHLLYNIKEKGNKAVHELQGSIEDAIFILSSLFKVTKWFQEVYGKSKTDLKNIKFVEPVNQDARQALHLLEENYIKLENDFKKLQKLHEQAKIKLNESEAKNLRKKAIKVASFIELNEKETRALIDCQLREVGWIVDSENINYKSKKTMPEKGKNMAIAEWKVENDWADYALFIGLDFVGIIEAKKKAKDVISDVSQAQVYSKKATEKGNVNLIGKWNEYNVPFMYSTNSRPFHLQLETKSGIWFLDGRKSTNHPKALRGWHSPEDIKNLLEKNIEKANEDLKSEPFDYLTNPDGLALREYQINAILAVENAVSESDKFSNRALIAMATGTGKTRTIIGLCYRLIKKQRFKRILFLVDRNILGRQAADSFKDVKIEDLQGFGNIYDIKDLKDKKPDIDTKIHFATVQGMVHRIYNSDDETLAVGTYDCIIVDEAHRGYILDRDMDEAQIEYKDQADFMSKYKMVLDYFDAFRVGLTATPAKHTQEIFGNPVFEYSYRQAVIDGYLIDHEPPYTIKTDRNTNGIKWKKGDKPKVYDRKTQTVIELNSLPDELEFEVEKFNKDVITEPFNRTILSELTKYIDPTSPKKTLIYAVSDYHADLIVKIFIEEFEKAGVILENGTILKITGSVQKPSPQDRVNLFKNERNPNIVVTVDLLTTGVDVPEICNLVFIRLVKSRILYEQMLGRATRKCDEIGKEIFSIFDAVGIYAKLAEYSDMKPVVTSVNTSLEEMITEMGRIKNEAVMKKHMEEIIAKLNRRKNKIKKENYEAFKAFSGGLSPEDFINKLKNASIEHAKTLVNKHIDLFRFLDKITYESEYQYISEHEDKVLDVERGYGEYKKPEDYIESFRNYINENINEIPALFIVCNKPKELTRKTLKELKILLDNKGFNTTNLNTAWKDYKNEDIAADIISYIRMMVLGNVLISHEERIKKAFQKIRGQRKWSIMQLKWLERFEKQLLKENVLTKEDFNLQPFKADGGFNAINKAFNNELDDVLDLINQNLYQNIA